ncbi:MAG TPA: M20 family metallopeptidase [Chloroflexota bacterium]|nr:M20 family metallopeptidase [Chloroflexota bacterium]
MTTADQSHSQSQFLEYLRPRLAPFLDDLASLSMVDCGTYDKAGVDAAGQIMRVRLATLDAAIEVHDGGAMGDSLVARWRGNGQARILLIGHLDTVYPAGWIADHPFAMIDDRVRGPGTADMKGGLLVGLYALEALRAAGFTRYAEITFVLNSDEEVGSPSSTALIAREAQGRDAVLVLEPGRASGDIVSARKGVAMFDLHVQGRAAHAGVEPQKGRSAILELAHQTIALQSLNDMAPGLTVNVGVVQGGTRGNVIAAEALARIDVRARTRADLDAVIAAMHEHIAQRHVPDTVSILSGGITHPPMERTPAVAQLVAWCQEAARATGFTVRDTETGGGSDGNTTAALGIPTLDGLGPVGGNAHSPDEYVMLSSIVPRTAMMAGLIQRICMHADQA